MKSWSILLLGALACAPSDQAAPDPTDQIRAMLMLSAAAWNRGDLNGFLSDYAQEPATSFVASGKVHYGFDWIRDNYAPRFAPTAARDSLQFVDAQARALGPSHAMATARYILSRGDSVTSTGLFTLVLRHQDDGWKILHDHTSRDD